MPPPVERVLIDGAAGTIEVALDWPDSNPKGMIAVGHPHPLFGGTPDNKVVTTCARAFAGLGWLAARPAFRGVGASAGAHDDGNGETEDFLRVLEAVPQLPEVRRLASFEGEMPLAAAGFSFGSFVAARAAQQQAAHRPLRHLILIGAAAGKWPMPPVARETLVIHGELDETIPLTGVLEWARPQDLPIVVVPGADHFFHRRLGLLKRLIGAHLQGMPAIDANNQID